MTDRAFDILLSKRQDGTWGSDALALPNSHLVNVSEMDGQPLPFVLKEASIVAATSGAPNLVGRLHLPESLVAQSVVDRVKLDLERQKLESDERAGRRTVWIGLATAIVSSAATIVVALIANYGSGADKAPKAYRELVECREELNRLATLAGLEQQTLGKLREASARSVDTCRGRLDAAISASKP